MTLPARITETEPPRIVLVGELWEKMDLQICAHGESLRWTCDLCAEFFETASELKKLLKLDVS